MGLLFLKVGTPPHGLPLLPRLGIAHLSYYLLGWLPQQSLALRLSRLRLGGRTLAERAAEAARREGGR